MGVVVSTIVAWIIGTILVIGGLFAVLVWMLLRFAKDFD